MTTFELYFYYAPDERIYGPADRNALQKWELEGRLVPTSKLQLKGTLEFVTWETVRSTPPLHLPESLTPELTPGESSPPEPPYVPPSPFPSAGSVIAEALQLYRKHFWWLLLFGGALQGMISIFGQLLEISSGSSLDPQKLSDPSQVDAFKLSLLLGWLLIYFAFFIFTELSLGVITVLLDYLQNQRKVVLKEILSFIPGSVLSVAPSSFIRIILPCCGSIPASIAFASGVQLAGKASEPVLIFLFMMSIILLIPPVLVMVRLLLTTQVIMLEGRKAFSALQRSNTLARYNPGKNIFSSGEIKLILLILTPIALSFISYLISLRLSGVHLNTLLAPLSEVPAQAKPISRILPQVFVFLAGSLITPLYASIIYCYYLHASEHVEQV